MKRKTFRGFLGVMILFILICISSNSSWAAGEKYPSGPIDLFNPFAPGGTADYLNRFLAKKLESYLGVTVVPQCKPGGGVIVLASFIANARPDGYTMGLLVPENIIEPILLGQAIH
jgi:tripartite-type tricarboxylate transporter receptor subunit TctC